MFLLVILIFFQLNCSLFFANGHNFSQKSLVKAIILFRHGMRAPLYPYSFDEHLSENIKYWPGGYGNLVQMGKSQMYELGQRLRVRYKNLLLPYDNTITENFKIVSTPVYRCYQSAEFLMAGLVSPEGQTWNESLHLPYISILNNSSDRVNIVNNKEKCPKYHEELVMIIQNLNDTNINYLKSYLSNHVSSVNVTDVTHLFMIADYLNTKVSMNLQLPKWASQNFIKKLNTFYVESFHYLSSTFTMRRLISGLLITDIVLHIREVIYNEITNSKMFLYSSHDSSLHTLAKSLGFELNFVPSYGASIIFEVYFSKPNNYTVHILYCKDYSFYNVVTWILPGCEEYCPVDRVTQLVEKYFIINWEEECTI